MPVVLLPCDAESQGWPTREFQVISSEALPGATGPLLVLAFNAISEQVDEWLAAWGMDPTGARIYVPDSETRSEIEGYLAEAAGLLEHWGFPPPELPIRSGKYQVVLAVETPAALRGEEAAGTYHPPICGTIGGYLFLSAAAILGDAEDDGGGRRLTPDGRETLAHELFHAVQANTRLFGAGCPPTVGVWITEGTADAIGIDVLRTLRGETVSTWIQGWGARSYSRRLPVPFSSSLLPRDWSIERLAAYFTSSFWRYLAEFQALGELPGPEPNPVDYSYLAAMLARGGAARDCDSPGAECDSELRWLDLGIQRAFGLTLSDLYPRFIDALALYGEHRIPAGSDDQRVINQIEWQEQVFNLPRRDASTGCENVYLTPAHPSDGRRQTVERDVIARFDAVAAECWSIMTEGFDGDVPVQIEVKAPPGATALSDLSAVIAGRPIWVNTAELDVDSETNQPTATWVLTLPLGLPRLFILTNVALDPGATTRMLNLPITFTALREYVAMSVSGSESDGGESGTGDGPTPADIAQPREFDVAEGDFRVLYAAPGGTLDLDHPICQVRIHLRSRQEDALSVRGHLSPPIRAGTYPIVRNPGGDIDRLGSDLYTSRTAGRGSYRYRMRGRSGSLEIESVDNLTIEGSLWTHVNRRLEGGDVNLLVRAEFSLQPGSGVGGILGPKASEHPCFTKSDGPSPSGGNGDGRENGENHDPEEQQDPEEDADGPGGLPAIGEADDQNAPGNPGGQPPPGADDVPSEGSGTAGGGAAAGTALQLEFLDERGGLIRSRPQVVRGNHSSERTDISATAIDLQLGLPLDFLAQCMRSATTDRRVEGIAGLLASGQVQPDGQFLVDISNAELDLESTTDDLRLEIEYERCRGPSGCSTDLLVLRNTDRSGGVELTTTGESRRVNVTGATLEATVDGHAGLCRNLIDFTFDLRH